MFMKGEDTESVKKGEILPLEYSRSRNSLRDILLWKRCKGIDLYGEIEVNL